FTVAFWGPEFNPSDLLPLDSTGVNPNSGVFLFEDTDGSGTFTPLGVFVALITGNPAALGAGDLPIALERMEWREQPELVDLTGDGNPDDLNGDGVITNADRAWVLTMRPRVRWPLPAADYRTGGAIGSGPT